VREVPRLGAIAMQFGPPTACEIIGELRDHVGVLAFVPLSAVVP